MLVPHARMLCFSCSRGGPCRLMKLLWLFPSQVVSQLTNKIQDIRDREAKCAKLSSPQICLTSTFEKGGFQAICRSSRYPVANQHAGTTRIVSLASHAFGKMKTSGELCRRSSAKIAMLQLTLEGACPRSPDLAAAIAKNLTCQRKKMSSTRDALQAACDNYEDRSWLCSFMYIV